MTVGPGWSPPVLCLVSDSRRLQGSGSVATRLIELAGRAADAGIDLFQIREPDLEASELYSVAAGAMALARGSRTRVVVNDRLDVALASGADGVHLKGDSIPPSRARVLAPRPFLIGRSVHGMADLRSELSDVDYLIAGTVFPTASKPGAATLLGLDGLAAIASAVSVPVLAIGGVTVDRTVQIATTGAAGIAAISMFTDVEEPLGALVAALRTCFTSFDTEYGAS